MLSRTARCLRRTALNAAKTRMVTPVARSMVYQSVANVNVRGFHAGLTMRNQESKQVREILSSELNLELDSIKEGETPVLNDTFQEFLDKSGFSVVERPGKNEAEIVKTTSEGEKVRVIFDVAQVSNLPYDASLAEAAATEEAINEDDYDALSDNFANVTVVVSKEGTSTLSFELLMNIQEGSFYVDSITPFESEELALSESADAEAKRDAIYHGPPFSNLDEQLQESLEVYLESRGINEDLAGFIGTYSEFKENNEYVDWLKKMKNFFE
ncbi:Mitochondrial acidic protein MAM33 [Nakaseomyces bracarensis]|uniref:Mitochondrial acidic protein MAM33 n=1 Tax=Nakaseomyces bracarensis TaxID=273131 RepID=A0ABR4NRR5_9SACH